MGKRIGIDAGGSLVKLAYEEEGRIHYKKVAITELQKIMDWLTFTNPTAEFTLTGGKAGFIQKNYLPNARLLPEFETTCKGIRFLIKEQDLVVANKYILVNIGTGTSFYVLDGEKGERILGSGIGGGTLMGLGSFISGKNDFNQITQLAEKGGKGQVDLLVKDIYESEETPINGNLTASNFAKVGQIDQHNAEDMLASLINMMAETIILLSMQAATNHQTKQILFIGSTLVGNAPLKIALKNYTDMLGIEAIFVPNGEFAGALGGLTP